MVWTFLSRVFGDSWIYEMLMLPRLRSQVHGKALGLMEWLTVSCHIFKACSASSLHLTSTSVVIIFCEQKINLLRSWTPVFQCLLFLFPNMWNISLIWILVDLRVCVRARMLAIVSFFRLCRLIFTFSWALNCSGLLKTQTYLTHPNSLYWKKPVKSDLGSGGHASSNNR